MSFGITVRKLEQRNQAFPDRIVDQDADLPPLSSPPCRALKSCSAAIVAIARIAKPCAKR